ncbi:hypothetical protein PPERSA_09693 [Pseudocohnilembus persalinus]|uniref:tRNA (guanine(26)-N(2))-dimethyltransferase n=1 Tax=Pseudocohnilembus persalinus TaxID=266149 RepID=A0A0V0R7U1_PSEPJ|nr:hypothetical protein PPERSA_09693 [Pseudocohnilembus persalinus]|eukprot:KRX10309.1 hypothetical protein PPERSA_09693 [Pseudocohnilembus persalinus]
MSEDQLKIREVVEGGIKLIMTNKQFDNCESDLIQKYHFSQCLERDISLLVLKQYISQHIEEKQQQIPHYKDVKIFMGNCQSGGLKALRMMKFIDNSQIQSVTVQNSKTNFQQYFKDMLKLNNISEQKFKVKQTEIEEVLYESSIERDYRQMYQILDLDINETQDHLEYISTAFKSLNDKGLVSLNILNTPSMNQILSNDKCFYKYGTIKSPVSDDVESQIRMIYFAISQIAVRQNKVITPILSFKFKKQIKLHFSVENSKQLCQQEHKKHSLVFKCSECPNFQSEIFINDFQKNLEKDCSCDQCGGKLEIIGPIYNGEINQKEFCVKLLKSIENDQVGNMLQFQKVIQYMLEQIIEYSDFKDGDIMGQNINIITGFLGNPNLIPKKQVWDFLDYHNISYRNSYLQPQIIKGDQNLNQALFDLVRYWNKNYMKMNLLDKELNEYQLECLNKSVKYGPNEKNIQKNEYLSDNKLQNSIKITKMNKLGKNFLKITEVRTMRTLKNLEVPQKEVKGGNSEKLQHGIQIRNSIVPKTADNEANSIGFSTFPQKNQMSAYNDKRLPSIDDQFGRTARIYVQDNCHMHDTPVQHKGYKWTLELPRQNIWKQAATGWTYSDDSLSKRNINFPSLENAIQYCQLQGLGYEVSYPKGRYTTKKSYAQNLQWPGHDEDVNEDC